MGIFCQSSLFVRSRFLLTSFLLVLFTSGSATAQVSEGTIVIPEFFEELYRINPTTGTAADLLTSPIDSKLFGHHLAIADENTAYVTSFSELYKFDFSSGQVSFIKELSFTPLEITMDLNGDLIAVDPKKLVRINPINGSESTVYTETFFGPSDAVVGPSGHIYLTEFFDALGVVSPSGGFSQIGNFAPSQFSHLDLGPDGQLYASSTVGASFYRINPLSGIGVELDSGVFNSIRDLQVDADGDIVFSGVVDLVSGVYRFDPQTQELSTIVDKTMVNNGFFDPLDIALLKGEDVQTFLESDLNQSGTVDAVDLAISLNAYGVSNQGDTDNDNDTDGADFLNWQRQYNGNLISVTSQPVPEPSSLMLLVGFVGLSNLVRHRNLHNF